MSESVVMLLGLYVAVAVIGLAVGVAFYRAWGRLGSREGQIASARIVLLAPVWPLALAVFILWLAVWLLPKSLYKALRGFPALVRTAFEKEN